MCGICGWMPMDPNAVPDQEVLIRMCAPLSNRGPDEAGLHIAPGIGLGHQRLKVIDLNSGRQPMFDATGRYSIVFNGEIYNYQELKKELLALGQIFVTQSDTEVLLYGLIRCGLGFLHKTNGMFAFALWDSQEHEVLLARDRFGIKPLYWGALPNGDLIFGSEASSLAASGLFPCSINKDSLAFFLALSYIPGQASIFKGINRLMPGSWLRFSPYAGIREGQWWDLADAWERSRISASHIKDWEDEFLSLLFDSVKIRMQSDVPLGAFLSGGLDSSSVVALMKAQASNVDTFTMSFAEPSHNEAPYAAETARLLGVKHVVEPADLGAEEDLKDIVGHLDEPFADTSIIPMHSLCKLAKKHVTVALTGDGADELLGGYITLKADALYDAMRDFPYPAIRLIRRIINLLPDTHKKIDFSFKLKQFFAAFPRSQAEAHACWRLLFHPEQLGRLFPEHPYLPDIFEPFNRAWEESDGLPWLDRFLYVDYKTWLADDILVKADRVGMRHGLELRSPFLDWRLFSLCAGMPATYKRQGNTGKVILRKVARTFLPSAVLKRPKRGFNAPVSQWLCGVWRDLATTEFQPSNLEAVGLNPQTVHTLWQEHTAYRKNHGFQLFNILVYLLWLKNQKSNFNFASI